MKFEEIFNEKGLYVADGFVKGCAVEIFEKCYPDENEMQIVEFNSQSHLAKKVLPLKVDKWLIEKDFRKVTDIVELFKEQDEEE